MTERPKLRKLDALIAIKDYDSFETIADMLLDHGVIGYHAESGLHALTYLGFEFGLRDGLTPVGVPVYMDRHYPLIMVHHEIPFGPDRKELHTEHMRSGHARKLSAGDDLAKRIREESYNALIVGMGPSKSHFYEAHAHYFLEYPTTAEGLQKVAEEMAKDHPGLRRGRHD